MAITTSLRAAAFAAALVLSLLFALSSGAPAAQADHCQAEELVYEAATGDGDWQSPIADDDDPRCVVAAQLGCPNMAQTDACVAGILNDEGCYIFRPTPQHIAGYVVCYGAAKGFDVNDIIAPAKE